MATTKEMIEEAELAKSCVTNSDMSEDQKRTYLRLINITTEATNGITPEQKIQKMTEAILLLASAQAKHIISIDEKIADAVKQANSRQCHDCRAMRYVVSEEEKQKNQQLIEQWKRENGITEKDESGQKPWADIFKEILVRPYVYVFLTLAIISPYGAQIVDKILQFYSK